MSVQGQTLPWRPFLATAARPPKPDMGRRGWDGRKVPTADPANPLVEHSKDAVA